MTALALSALIAAYLFVPNAWFRFILGLQVPLKIFQERKTEDLTRAVVTLGALFLIALLAVRGSPFFKSHPFDFPDSAQVRSADYELVASCLYSEEMFKQKEGAFWEALSRTLRRQGRFACWYYVLVSLWAYACGKLGTHYGSLRRYKLYSRFADFYLLPHISQWYVLLTPFTFPDPRTLVKADVLMTDDTLYRGDIAEHFLDKDGSLSGIFLKNPTRFDRRSYLKEKDTWGSTRSTEVYWRPIPSAKLYLVADKIVNLNLNYEPPTAIADVFEKYISRLQMRPVSVTVSPGTGARSQQRIGAELKTRKRL